MCHYLTFIVRMQIHSIKCCTFVVICLPWDRCLCVAQSTFIVENYIKRKKSHDRYVCKFRWQNLNSHLPSKPSALKFIKKDVWSWVSFWSNIQIQFWDSTFAIHFSEICTMVWWTSTFIYDWWRLIILHYL